MIIQVGNLAYIQNPDSIGQFLILLRKSTQMMLSWIANILDQTTVYLDNTSLNFNFLIQQRIPHQHCITSVQHKTAL